MKEENTLDAYMLSNKEADIAYTECMNAINLFDDYAETSYFEDGTSSGKNFFQTLIDKIKALAEAVVKFFTDLGASAKAKIFGDKLSKAAKDKNLANKKVEVMDDHKIMNFFSSYQKKVYDAKSEEEIDKIVSDYEKKRNTAGIFAVVLTVAAIAGKKIYDKGYPERLAKQTNTANEQLAKLCDTVAEYNMTLDAAPDAVIKDLQHTQKKVEKLNNKKAKLDAKQARIAKRKASVISKMGSEGITTLKSAVTNRFSKIGAAISGAASEVKATAKATKNQMNAGVKNPLTAAKNARAGLAAGRAVGKEAAELGYTTESAEEAIFSGEIYMEESDMSTEDLFGIDPFSESSEDIFGTDDEAFEESASDVAGKISAAIKKLIEKIKQMYTELKKKMEVAKLKAILGSSAAKSTIQIRFSMRDKDIAKQINMIEKCENKYTVGLKKIEQKYVSGKMSTDEMYDAIDKLDRDFYEQVDHIYNTNASIKAEAAKRTDMYNAREVKSYCEKLILMQTNVNKTLWNSIEKETSRLEREAAELERAKAEEAKRQASIKYKLAQAYARANKKALGTATAIISVVATITAFGLKLKSKSTNVNESAEDVFDPSLSDFFEESGVENEFMEAASEELEKEYDQEYLEHVEAVLAHDYDVDLDSFGESSDDIFGSDDEFFTEGAGNKEISAYYKAAFKTFKSEIKDARAAYKKEDYDTAIKHTKNAQKAMDEATDKMREVDDSIGDAITGMLIGGLLSCAKLLVVTITSFGILTGVDYLKQLIEELMAYNDDDKHGNQMVRHVFNHLRTQLIGNAKLLSKVCDSIIAKCETKKRKAGAKTESVEDTFDPSMDEFFEDADVSEFLDDEDALAGLV